jgi:hypothetical protein
MSLPTFYDGILAEVFSTNETAETFVLNGSVTAQGFYSEDWRKSSPLQGRYLDQLPALYTRTTDVVGVKAGDALVLRSGTLYVQGVESTSVGSTTMILNGTKHTLVHSTGTYPVFEATDTDSITMMMAAGYDQDTTTTVMLSNTLPHGNQVQPNDLVVYDGIHKLVAPSVKRNRWFNLLGLKAAD